jgi:hypothetical protein
MLERLAEMFPNQDYSAKLDRYISNNSPTSASEIEYLIQKFERQEFRGFN